MQASIDRARGDEPAMNSVVAQEFTEILIRSFDECLERIGTSDAKFRKFIDGVDAALNASSHAGYQGGLERLGLLLGYRARRPKYAAAPDCVWAGDFGQSHELLTFEAKVEHQAGKAITHGDVGQAVAQYNRAVEEHSVKGYTVRSLIVTHLKTVSPEGKSALGAVRLISRDSILALWHQVRSVLELYRSGWSVDDIHTRRTSATRIRARLPNTGWMLRAVDSADPWISREGVLKEWTE